VSNYKLLIEYDGTDYAGWQIQKNAVTVQQKITHAVEVITKDKINLIGSGRTDTGVHALGQVANFRIEHELDLRKFHYSLNAVLPNDISVVKIEKVNESFHARYDAKYRSYIYIFLHNKSPFYEKYSYLFPHIKSVDLDSLNMLSRSLLCGHDFTSLSKKNSQIEEKFCVISEIHWRSIIDKTIFYITANRFLHGMVRTIIGTLLFAAEKNLNEDYLKELLEAKDRTKAEQSVPAKGLFLFKVRY
jgi:tRNA pseudouridine38-40 synthase